MDLKRPNWTNFLLVGQCQARIKTCCFPFRRVWLSPLVLDLVYTRFDCLVGELTKSKLISKIDCSFPFKPVMILLLIQYTCTWSCLVFFFCSSLQSVWFYCNATTQVFFPKKIDQLSVILVGIVIIIILQAGMKYESNRKGFKKT